MKSEKHLWISLFLFLIFSSVTAQEKWSLEFRPNLDFPITKVENEKINTGFGFDASLSYNITEQFGVYVGWGWNIYRAENLPETGNIDMDETGYTFGIKFMHPISESSLSYFIRLGGIYAHVEVENEAGKNIADTGHEPGWEISGGFDFSHLSSFSLRPQVGYRNFSADFSSEDVIKQIDLNNFFFGIGIAKAF